MSKIILVHCVHGMHVLILVEHGMSGGLRPVEDPGHRQLRAGDACPAQIQQNPLCNENFRQTEGEHKLVLFIERLVYSGLTECNQIFSC